MTPTILCVDDEAAMRRMLSDTLTPLGYHVITAASVQEAVEAAQHHHIDLIILDIFLPDTQGFSLFERLKEETPNGKAPVVMASGCGSIESRNLASRRGAIAYLQKPFQIKQLLSVISWAAPAPDPHATLS